MPTRQSIQISSVILLLLVPTATVQAAEADVTFNKHVAPIVFEQCAGCHREGEVAPFPLLSYADVQKRAKQIRQVTGKKFMPPWKSLAGHGSFVDERRLTDEQIATIARWVEAGTPKGDAADLPPAPKFREGW
jgi:mono/diheme cytochrome c family protein